MRQRKKLRKRQRKKLRKRQSKRMVRAKRNGSPWRPSWFSSSLSFIDPSKMKNESQRFEKFQLLSPSRSRSCTVAQNQVILRHRIIHFPMSSGVSEWANEWAQLSTRAKHALQSKGMSEWGGASEWLSGASKQVAQYLCPDSWLFWTTVPWPGFQSLANLTKLTLLSLIFFSLRLFNDSPTQFRIRTVTNQW